jgi:hypothetical protein
MRTVCGICGVALVCADDHDDSNAFCSDCRTRNFGGQSFPEMDVPHITIVGLTTRQRQAYERLARRHREETHDAG